MIQAASWGFFNDKNKLWNPRSATTLSKETVSKLRPKLISIPRCQNDDRGAASPEKGVGAGNIDLCHSAVLDQLWRLWYQNDSGPWILFFEIVSWRTIRGETAYLAVTLCVGVHHHWVCLHIEEISFYWSQHLPLHVKEGTESQKKVCAHYNRDTLMDVR